MRSSVLGLGLSTLVLLAPDLTLAPIVAGEPIRTAPAAEVGPERTSRVLPQPSISAPAAPPRPLAIAAPPRAATPPSAAPAASPSEAERFAAALEAARSAGGAFGVTFTAVRNGELVWSGAAGRTRESSAAIGVDDALVIGSLTKTFVAATILQLAEEGRLSLSDPVRDHLPDMRALSAKITIRQLLDHTSGLADVFNDTTRVGLEQQPGRAWTAPEIMATLHDPWYQPGQGWAYANTNYYLLGLIAEAVTGATLAEELDRRFLDPMSLDETRMLTPAADDGGLLSPAWSTIFWASGAMTASAPDIAAWGNALYDGEVVGDSTAADMRRFNSHDYGLGTQRIRVPGAAGIGHTGLLNTYTSLLLHLPDQDVTLALLVNRTHVDLGAMLAARPPGGGQSLLELLGVKRAARASD